jgi:peptide/nickel transport system substrate-binding protein
MPIPNKNRFFATCLLSVAAVLGTGAAPAVAADLKIGLSADVSSLDPHYLNIAPNVAFSSHLFDALVHVDPNGQLIPGLATEWRPVDPTTWEFKLRQGVKFHDGSDLTAEDVIFSLDRPAALTGSPGPFTSYTKQIIDKQAVDRHTIRIKTAAPYGPLPLDLSTIFIISKKAAQNAATEDFNSGKALVGTGPFKFASFKRGDSIEVVRNNAYWGDKPAWDKVTLRIITSDASRLAALLAGDLDAIENVPTADLARVKSNANLALEQKVSWRTIFWHLDQRSRNSPFVSDKSGKSLPINPLRDVRVRQAISMAVNRPAIVSRTMEKLAMPASNLVSPGIFGYNDALKVDAYDPAGAKKLLAQAGYPDGFAMTVHGPNNRYINDEQVVQTVAQLLNRIGIQTKVETMPLSVYFSKARAGDFSFAMLGWGTLAADFALRTLVGTPNPDTGWGTWNWGGYSNKKVDELVRSSLSTVDKDKRETIARQAMATALQDYAVIPMHHQYATWAMRKELKYPGRIDEFTFAHQFRPK